MTRPVHGGANIDELRALGLRPDDVLDFSASVNPLGAPPGARAAMLGVNLAAYPDPACTELRETLARRHGVFPEQILVGNGSTELIHLTAMACLARRKRAIIFTPTFGEYEAACQAQDADIIGIAADESAAFGWDISAAAALIAKRRPAVVFLCNPNNPTGRYLPEDDARRIAEAVGADGLLLLDEAYLPFVARRWDSLPLLDMGNVALLRSMTKDYGLTALRLGYMLAPPAIIERVGRRQHSWSVNALAQAARHSRARGRGAHPRGQGRCVPRQAPARRRACGAWLGMSALRRQLHPGESGRCRRHPPTAAHAASYKRARLRLIRAARIYAGGHTQN